MQWTGDDPPRHVGSDKGESKGEQNPLPKHLR